MEGNETIYVNNRADIEKILQEGHAATNGKVTLAYVDDDPMLLRAIHRVLNDLDGELPPYRLLLFRDPRLIEPACERGIEFKILLSDYEMPHKKGIEVLRDVKRRRPETITGLMSGTYEQGDDPADAEIVDFFLPKPLDLEYLQNTLLRYARA